MKEGHQQSNVLLLFSDQMRPFELGCYGHPVVKTPNLDRLAGMGVRFEHAVTNNPVCTPARSTLISGQYGRTCTGILGCCGEPVNNRTWFPDQTLPETLKEAGYRTMLTGKWHIGPRPELVGFERACYPLVGHKNIGQVFFDEERHGEQINEFAPDFEVKTSCEFIKSEHDRPWFLFHNLSLPHMPYFDVPDTYRKRYSPHQVELRPNVIIDGERYHDEDAFKVYLFDHLCTKMGLSDHLKLPENYDIHQLYAEYCGMISCVDDQVGKLLDALERSGQLENTLIIFSSDHGENMGSHHLWNKISVNDEAIRVPLFFVQPGSIAPRVIYNQVGSLVDIAPTILGLLGVDVPEAMQGDDLSGLIHGRNELVRHGTAFIENLRGELAIRTPSHLYAVLTKTGDPGPERELLDDHFMFNDLADDPYQLVNLAGTGEEPELMGTLKKQLLDWDRQTPWLKGSHGGVYGQGPKHDPPPPKRNYGR